MITLNDQAAMEHTWDGRSRPPVAELDQWLAAADGVGSTRERAVAEAGRNLAAFLDQHNVRRVGDVWVHSLHAHHGRSSLIAIVKCRITAR